MGIAWLSALFDRRGGWRKN